MFYAIFTQCLLHLLITRRKMIHVPRPLRIIHIYPKEAILSLKLHGVLYIF